MSRPTKTDSEKLSCVLPPIRCTDTEKQKIRKRAYVSGLSMSEYVRHMALEGRMILKGNTINLEAVHQLRKLGVNLNQQTKKLNATGVLPMELKTLWSKLETILDKLME